MSIALITGSSGLIGSEASTFFASKGFEVLGIDNNFRKFFFGSEGEVNTNRNRIINKVKRYKHFDIDPPKTESSTIAGHIMDITKKIPLYGEVIKDDFFSYKIL